MPEPDEEYSDTALLEEVRLWLERVSQSLPDKIEVASLGVREKVPFKALAVREALIWRAEEMARIYFCRVISQPQCLSFAELLSAQL